jgi:outer membrane protein TolC
VLELAEARSESIAIAQSAVRRAEADPIRAHSGLLPQLSAAGSYDRALASEFSGVLTNGSTAAPCAGFAPNQGAPLDVRVAELERALDCGAAGQDLLTDIPAAPSGGGLADLPFGRKNTFRASLSFSQNLYSGGRNGAQEQIAGIGRDSAQLGVVTTRAQLLLDVTQAYYDAVLSDRLVSIAEATLEQTGATLQQTQAGFDAGTQPEFEVLRARVSRDSQTPVVIRQRVNREVALLRLKELLDLPANFALQLADAFGDETLAPPPMFAERVTAIERVITPAQTENAAFAVASDQPLPARTAVSQVEASVRLSEASLSLTEAQRMPSVSLTSNYSRIAYPSNALLPVFNRSNWTVGAAVQVPILTGGRQRGDELGARADLEQARLRLRQTQQLADFDTRSAWAELIAARAAWEATAGTVQQASRAYEIADVRYRAGVSTQLELTDSRLLLQQAEANRTLAARDLQVARARVALLPDLPIGATVARTAVQVPAAPSQPQQQQQQQGTQLRNASAAGQGAQSQAGTR